MRVTFGFAGARLARDEYAHVAVLSQHVAVRVVRDGEANHKMDLILKRKKKHALIIKSEIKLNTCEAVDRIDACFCIHGCIFHCRCPRSCTGSHWWEQVRCRSWKKSHWSKLFFVINYNIQWIFMAETGNKVDFFMSYKIVGILLKYAKFGQNYSNVSSILNFT